VRARGQAKLRWVGGTLALASLSCLDVATSFDGALQPVVLDTRFQVAAPADPMPAVLTPCPMGWTPVDAGTTVACEPWPAGAPDTCPAGSAQFPGDPQCAPVGSACPSGMWTDALPAGKPVLYVLAGASGGSGTQGAPFGQLADALAAASPSTIVALGPGTYTSAGPLPAQVTLWGACVTQTTVTSDAGTPVIASSGPGVEVHNLRITGEGIGLYASGAQAALHAQDVVVDGARGVGWSAENGASATGDNVVIRNTRALADGTEGDGIQALTGGHVDAGHVFIESCSEFGVAAMGAGSTMALSDVAIHNTHARSDGVAGYGAAVDTTGTLSLTRAVVENSHDTGVLALGNGTITLSDTVVRGTLFGSGGGGGYGVLSISSTVNAQRVLIERNPIDAKVRDSGGKLNLTDAVVRLTAPTASSNYGDGIVVVTGAALVLERVLLDQNNVAGLALGSAGSKVTATDVVSSGTYPTTTGMGGWGIAVLQGGSLDATRVRLENNTWVGMSTAASTVVTATDLAIVGTHDLAGNGAGLLMQDGSVMTVTRGLLSRNAVTGFVEQGAGTTFTVQDFAVDQTQADSVDGLEGEGAIVLEGASFTGAKVRFSQNLTVALFASSPGTQVELSQVELSDVTAPPCIHNPMCDGLQPTGALVMFDAEMKLTDFLITRNGGIGAQIADGGQLDLSQGEISHHLIGVNVDGPYDTARLNDRVQYIDDMTKLGSMTVPLPSPPKF
jgi:hypothetical protein